MNLFLFEDTAVDRLSPITLTRPAWTISCGSYRLIDLMMERSFSAIGSQVRPHLQALQTGDWPNLKRPEEICESSESVLLLNARIVPSIANVEEISKLATAAESSNEVRLYLAGDVVAAAVGPSALVSDGNVTAENLQAIAAQQGISVSSHATTLKLFEYPHDVIGQHMAECGNSIKHRISTGDYQQLADGVFVANASPQTTLPDSCHFDTREGPVVFESNIRVGPFCFFRGPVHVAANCKISEHSSIKDSVAISHTCKMGGEIEGVQTEAWSNKQHFGFLGHSWIGSWINLGAGTCNSDLKNTYGTVNMTCDKEKVSTGMQFVGCVIGDYSRSAINTSIYTGKTIGVGSTLYGITTRNVPSFVNWAQVLDQYGEVPPEVIATIQKRMFARRDVEQRPCDIRLISDVFSMTSGERDPNWSSDPVPQ